MGFYRFTRRTEQGRTTLRNCTVSLRNAMDRLADYEDAEEQGLIVRLPCKVGDKVYTLWTCGRHGKSIAEFQIKHVDIDFWPEIEFAFAKTNGKSGSYWYRKATDIGKTVFLTREEAEQALKERGSE